MRGVPRGVLGLPDPDAAGAAVGGREFDRLADVAFGLHVVQRRRHDLVGRIVRQVHADARVAGDLLGLELGDDVVGKALGCTAIAGDL